jgi:hypothetical protein
MLVARMFLDAWRAKRSLKSCAVFSLVPEKAVNQLKPFQFSRSAGSVAAPATNGSSSDLVTLAVTTDRLIGWLSSRAYLWKPFDKPFDFVDYRESSTLPVELNPAEL